MINKSNEEPEYIPAVTILGREITFPPVEWATKEGLLAIGGDLSLKRLMEAYKHGIFPWYEKGSPILWWSPDPRMVLFPDELKISKSMKKILKKMAFEVTFDQNFEEVIKACRAPRKSSKGTWITEEMLNAYIDLHKHGLASSVETRVNGKIAGGLYGVRAGKCFCGESMFSKSPNASKTALIVLVEKLKNERFKIIDCQVYSEHLESLGAREIPRKEFLKYLK